MRGLMIAAFMAMTLLGHGQEQVRYEYLTMVQRYNKLHITIGGESYEEIKASNEDFSKKYEDFRPLLKKIMEYEKEGWTLIFNNLQANDEKNYVMMRRKKPFSDVEIQSADTLR